MKTSANITGVFDLDTGRLIGLAPKGTSDVTYVAGQDTATPAGALPVTATTDPVTGGIRTSIGKLARRASINRRSAIVSTDAPTITYSASAPAGRAMLPQLPDVRPVGCALAYNDSNNTLSVSSGGAFVGSEFFLDGDTVSFGWRCQTATKERFMFFVDGRPVSLTPATPSVTTSAGNFYYVTLAFGSVAERKIEILATSVAALVSIVVPVMASVRPTSTRRIVHIVGDSFNGGSDATTEPYHVPNAQLAMTYDIDVTASALGGTGYVKTNGGFPVFGDSTRVSVAALVAPDEIVFMGSVNDDGLSGIQSAASACFAAYKQACPDSQLIVFGPQPSNATDTISANRKANASAVQAAANGVATYIDMIGFAAGDFTAATIGMTAQPGQVCSYLGALWRYNKASSSVIPNANYAPGGSAGYWTLLTMDYYGTGKVGSTASDGTRDVLLYSDGIHPMPRQCRNLAERIISAVSAVTVF